MRATPVVKHKSVPQLGPFALQWTIPSARFEELKQERSLIKVQVVRVKDKEENVMGFILLDPRTATLASPKEQYHTLLSNSYKHDRPELLLGFSLSLEASHPSPGRQRPPSGRKATPTIDGLGDVRLTRTGEVVIGAKTRSSSLPFVFTFVISGARGLASLGLPAESDTPYYFQYSVLGIDITSGTFSDPLHPRFPVERASMRILVRDVPDAGEKLLSGISPIHIFLRRGDEVLAVADVPVTSIRLKEGAALKSERVLVPIHSTNASHDAVVCSVVTLTEGSSLPPRPAPTSLFVPRTPQTTAEAEKRIFRYSIDVISIGDLDVPAANVFARYTHDAFGAGAVCTHPPVRVTRRSDVQLPNGFCSFEFSAARNELNQMLVGETLAIEILHRDKYVKDVTVGVAAVPMDAPLNETHRHSKGKLFQLHDSRFPIVSSDPTGEITRAGTIRVRLCIEDGGPSGDVLKTTMNGAQGALPSSMMPLIPPAGGAADTGAPGALAEWEVEAWTRQQMADFQVELKELEEMALQQVIQEADAKEEVYVALFEKKMQEYAKLEGKLRGALLEVESRKKHIAKEEEALGERLEVMHSEHGARKAELEEKERRIREEMSHQVQVERSRCVTVARENSKMKDAISTAEENITRLSATLEKLQQEAAMTPAARVQLLIETAQVEAAKVKEQTSRILEVKQHYREQCVSALRELGKMKRSIEAEDRASFDRERELIQRAHVVEAAYMEMDALKAERAEIAALRADLVSIASQSKQEVTDVVEPAATADESVMDDAEELEDAAGEACSSSDETEASGNETPSENHQLARLLRERDELLSSGVYGSSDMVIVALDGLIRQQGGAVPSSTERTPDVTPDVT